MAEVTALSNLALLEETRRLAANERGSTVALIIALTEVDSRRLYLGEGYSSMFRYCRNELHLSESAAYSRIEVARVSRAFPQIVNALERGALNPTTAMLIAPHLRPDNADDLIEAASYKTRRDVERLIAVLRPKPDAPTLIRKQPEARATLPTTDLKQPAKPLPQEATHLGTLTPTPSAQAPITSASRPAVVAPLSATLYKIQFTADEDTHDKLRRAQALLRHQIPNGDIAVIVNRALTLLIAETERRKLGVVHRPREKAPATSLGSRHIPSAIRRAVVTRDGNQCAFVGRQGRCPERDFLEFHHVKPFAAGGTATTENIQLRCRAHNVHEAVLYFGEGALPSQAKAEPG